MLSKFQILLYLCTHACIRTNQLINVTFFFNKLEIEEKKIQKGSTLKSQQANEVKNTLTLQLDPSLKIVKNYNNIY